MEYWIAIDASTPFGVYLLTQQGKIGGATNLVTCGTTTHPLIVAKDMDWSHPSVLRMTHIQNPAGEDRKERPLAVQCSSVLFAARVEPVAADGTRMEQAPSSSLH
jgi:hypothetical protein